MTYTEHVTTSNLSPALFVKFISFCSRSNEAEISRQTTVARLCCCYRRRDRFPRRSQLIIKAPVTCVNSGEQEAQIEIDFSDTVMIISMEDIQYSQAHKCRALVILDLQEPVDSGVFFFFFLMPELESDKGLYVVWLSSSIWPCHYSARHVGASQQGRGGQPNPIPDFYLCLPLCFSILLTKYLSLSFTPFPSVLIIVSHLFIPPHTQVVNNKCHKIFHGDSFKSGIYQTGSDA